jgi:RimJ/RimL family protein N-acetyltransferase
VIAPTPIVLEGHGVRLEPLERSHADALVAAAADGELWKLWYVAVAQLVPDHVAGWMDTALAGQRAGSMLPWVVRELTTGDVVGSTRYHDIVAAIDRVEIGFTFYAARWQRTHVNTACKLLLLEHAFDTLGCRVVGFRVDNLNERSQAAMEALGAKKDGVLRRFQARLDGSPRDTYVYSILAEEWPSVRRRLEERLRKHGDI